MYRKKIYGCNFDIIRKYEGWDIGIWMDSMPTSFVMLKPINERDFVFVCLNSVSDDDTYLRMNSFCGIIKPFWMACINGEFKDISEDDAKELLNTKLKKYDSIPKIQEGEYIQVYNPNYDEYENVQAEEIRYEEDGIYLICDSGTGYSFSVNIDKYGKWGWLLKQDQ